MCFGFIFYVLSFLHIYLPFFTKPHPVKPDTFSDIRPYIDAEVPAALHRLMREPVVFQLTQYLYPDKTQEELIRLARSTRSVRELQRNFSYDGVTNIMQRTISAFTHSGFDQLQPESGGYLVMSNHRDIILDSAILNVLLVDHGCETAETGTGDNLFLSQVITDLLRLNRSFRIHRPTQPREMYMVSQRLSSYILSRREAGASVWIAQRGGRTKDGHDQTDTGLLKMLAMAESDFVKCFDALRVCPMAISYEYDPCDRFKVQERYLAKYAPDHKHRRKDDFKSMLAGVTDPKGRTHFTLTPQITSNELTEVAAISEKNDRFRAFTELIDTRIHQGYQLFPVHYVAADWQAGTTRYAAHYTQSESDDFHAYVARQVGQLEGDPDILTDMMLDIYAGPVKQKH